MIGLDKFVWNVGGTIRYKGYLIHAFSQANVNSSFGYFTLITRAVSLKSKSLRYDIMIPASRRFAQILIEEPIIWPSTP